MDASAESMFLNSKLVGAAVRGLPSSAVEQPENPENGFKYINCLDRKYRQILKNVSEVRFDISRYGEKQRSLKFDSPVSENDAILAVEKYLSEPLTEEYYDMIKDDLFHGYSWDEAKACFTYRGDCLTDCIFLEKTEIIDGTLIFFCGS